MKKVADYMSKDVISVKPETSIRKVIEILIEKKISGVAVVNEKNELLGLCTEGDILRSESLTVSLVGDKDAQIKINNDPVEKIMKRQVLTIKPNDFLTKACGLINVYRFKRLIVVDDLNRVAGVLSRRDLIRAML